MNESLDLLLTIFLIVMAIALTSFLAAATFALLTGNL